MLKKDAFVIMPPVFGLALLTGGDAPACGHWKGNNKALATPKISKIPFENFRG
ncbi:MAG: hypothetical protein IIB64_01960 [Proteobacteria bacterium]|nr:hypothetical protein [Pseudomonadota bacterium]